MPNQKQDQKPGRQGQQNVDPGQDRPQTQPDQNRGAGEQVRTDKTDQDRMRRTDDDDRDDA